MPAQRTVLEWLSQNDDFRGKYAHAREAQADTMDDRILEVADNVESGKLAPDAARVVLGALQWRAAKLKPKKYGERIDIEQNTTVAHYVVEVPSLARDVTEWLSQNASSSGVPSLAHSPRS